jgi:hypothetical protein
LDSQETDMPPEEWFKFAFEKLKRCWLKTELNKSLQIKLATQYNGRWLSRRNFDLGRYRRMHLEPIGADILPNLQGPRSLSRSRPISASPASCEAHTCRCLVPGAACTNVMAAPPRANDCFGKEPARASSLPPPRLSAADRCTPRPGRAPSSDRTTVVAQLAHPLPGAIDDPEVPLVEPCWSYIPKAIAARPGS